MTLRLSADEDDEALRKLRHVVTELNEFTRDWSRSLKMVPGGGLEREVVLTLRCLLRGRESDHSPLVSAARRTLRRAEKTWGVE